MHVNRPQFEGIPHRVVTVLGTDVGNAMVTDALGNSFEVRLGMRAKGVGLPVEGERWLIAKRLGMWSFDSMIDAPQTPTISGDRTGMHPVTAQVLDAMALHGLVIDTTTGVAPVSLDGTTDPGTADVAMTEPLIPDIDAVPISDDSVFGYPVLSVGVERATTSGRDADDGGPRTTKPRTEEIAARDGAGTVPISLVTYMQGNQIGPLRAAADLVRLDKTRAQIVAFQGVEPADRDSLLTGWSGWDCYRPAGHGATNTIAWRAGQFEMLNSFTYPYATSGVDRYLNGVRLRHIASQVHLTVLDTQLEPWAAFGGAFGRPSTPVTDFKAQMAILFAVVKARLPKGPLFLCGNFNVDWRRDHRLRNPGLPYTTLRGLGLHANWDDLGLSAQAPVGSQTYYDQIYCHAKAHTAHPEYQQVLHGYYGPHRPVLVTYRVQRH